MSSDSRRRRMRGVDGWTVLTGAVIELRPSDPGSGGSLAEARALVESTPSSGSASDRARTEMLDFIDRHPDALFRHCLSGHLTGSALVVDADRRRVLVMLHTKLGRWLQPGGHADGEGHLDAVALREATEETGIAGLTVLVPPVDCDVHTIPARGDEPEHDHLDLRFVVLAPPGAEPEGNHESRDLRWVTLDELGELGVDEGLLRLAGVGLAAVSDPTDSG